MSSSQDPHLSSRGQELLASVIIPIKNGATTLGVQLDALKRQTLSGQFEIIIADNGSEDNLDEVLQYWQALIPNLRKVDASKVRGVSHARNRGLSESKTDMVLICDADDRVCDDWVEAMLDSLNDFDMVAGSLEVLSLNTPLNSSWRNPPKPGHLPTALNFLPYAHGCNMGIKKEVALAVGGWDESLIDGGDDIDFSWRVQLQGYTIVSSKRAIVSYRYRETMLKTAIQGYKYNLAKALLYTRYEQHGVKAPHPVGEIQKLIGWLVQFPKLFMGPRVAGKWLYAISLSLADVVSACSFFRGNLGAKGKVG
jgi:glycosyltransferase involved in cell wall biosynthesis